ncbi:hypothetical protein GBAR_LOCUS15118, partial [Geodia barretti]
TTTTDSDVTEFWASDYLYLHAFRAFSANTFLVEGNRRVEVLELNQVRAQDIVSPAARCLECKVVGSRQGCWRGYTPLLGAIQAVWYKSLIAAVSRVIFPFH